MNSTTSVPVADIVAALKVRYPAAVCALDWGGQHDSDPETRRRNGWRLLVMARLSAQCTDARVNQVCRELFRLYPTPGALAAAPQADVEAVIRPCGLFRTKAKSPPCDLRHSRRRLGGIGAGGHGYPSLPARRGRQQDCQSRPRRPVRSAGHRGRYALHPHLRAAWVLPRGAEGPRPGGTHPFPADPAGGSSRISATASCSSDGIPAPPAPRRAGRVPCGHSVRTGESFPDGYKKPPNKSAVP